MKKDFYESLEEWKPDYEKLREHINDQRLVGHIEGKVRRSSSIVKEQITEFLENATLENNPWWVINRVSNRFPDYFVIVNTKEDPFFKV